MRLGYIQVPVGFKCEASIPKGVIGFLEGFKHRASHSFQYLVEYTHTSEAGVYTGYLAINNARLSAELSVQIPFPCKHINKSYFWLQ